MTLKKGYAVIDLPPASKEILEAFGALPKDPYCGGDQRFRRFSQYRIEYNGGCWHLECLPHRPFIQAKKYNSFVGGIPRYLEPLTIDPSPQIDAGAKAIPLDTKLIYQINVHQCRVITNAHTKGISVPEGPHRDGHEYGLLAVFQRYQISGGVTQLMPIGGGEPFFEVTLQPNQALVYDDNKMWHFASDIEPISEETGIRDLWIVAFNQWKNRRYGEQFEAEAGKI